MTPQAYPKFTEVPPSPGGELISPSKLSFSSNTSSSDPTSSILNELETRFASGMERDRSDLHVAIHSAARNFRTSAR